jgi:hypothetical protein
LYNNLHFPNFKDVAPCMVIPLKNCFTDLSADNHGKEESGNRNILGQSFNEYFQCTGGTVQAENELSKNHTDLSYCVELPTCTVCLRRLQCVASGVEGGNDIPVSMWFSGNVARCRVCGVYGEGAENDGAVGSSKSSQVRWWTVHLSMCCETCTNRRECGLRSHLAFFLWSYCVAGGSLSHFLCLSLSLSNSLSEAVCCDMHLLTDNNYPNISSLSNPTNVDPLPPPIHKHKHTLSSCGTAWCVVSQAISGPVLCVPTQGAADTL